jgi:hypothetical protein
VNSLLARWDVALAELAPLVRRVVTLDPSSLVRLRAGDRRLTLLVRLPFGVLAARTVTTDEVAASEGVDVTVAAADLMNWLDGDRREPPSERNADWRGAAPPVDDWRRLDTVPDDVIRHLVRTGAHTVRRAAEREGVPGAQPRAAVTEALLDAVVLTASDDAGHSAVVTLRTLSALTRLGFLARQSHIAVDVAGRWTRVAAAYGSVYAERPGLGINVLH